MPTMDKTKVKERSERSEGAYYMRHRDAFIVHVFERPGRQQVVSSGVYQHFNDFNRAFPDAFPSVRALHRFIYSRGRRRLRGTIYDRISVDISRVKVPVWVARSRSRSVSTSSTDDSSSSFDSNELN